MDKVLALPRLDRDLIRLLLPDVVGQVNLWQGLDMLGRQLRVTVRRPRRRNIIEARAKGATEGIATVLRFHSW